jgi:xylitol oxidase
MRNWAGNYEYRARRLLEPRTVEELQGMVRATDHVRVLGSRHSFNAIADTTWDHLSLARMPRSFRVDPVARTVRVDGATRYGELCERLDEEGFALGAMASLPHI